MTKVSLVIPYYNGSKFIGEALDSAHSQTVPYSDILVIDDGSEISEYEYIKTLIEKKFPAVRLVRKENGGQGDARNLGVKKSSGTYVCFLDQDDRLRPEHNFVLSTEICKQPFPRGWVYANFNTIDSFGNLIIRSAIPAHSMRNADNIYKVIDHDLFILPSAVIIDKKAFEKVGGFDTQFTGYEDDDLFIRLFLSGVNHNFKDEIVYDWRMHETQTSGSLKMSESRLKFIRKWCSYNVGFGVNEILFKNSIIKRFKSTIIRDVINSRDKYKTKILKKIAKEYYIISKKCNASFWSVLLPVKLTIILPKNVMICFARLYVFLVKRNYR